MTKKQIKEISKSLMFNPSEEILNMVLDEANILMSKIEELQKINTNNVTPMTRIDNTPITFLRDDIVGKCLDKKKILESAPNFDEDFIIINRRNKND